MNNYSFVYEPL